MIETCPHCYERIIPTSDGQCPSCRKNLRDTVGAEPDLVMVVIRGEERLPSRCIICGQATERRQRVTESRKRHGSQSDTGGGFAGFLGGMLGMLVERLAAAALRQRRDPYVSVSVPVCGGCRNDARVKPKYVDLETYEMKFLAHRNFASALLHFEEE